MKSWSSFGHITPKVTAGDNHLMKFAFILENHADPDEMPLHMAYLGLHCLSHVYMYIYVSVGIQNEKG